MLDFDKLREKARRVARRRWMQHNLREISDNDNHAGLERLYKVTDPWSLDSPLEHARFVATNNAIEANFGKVDTLLEIGCSEGVQSTYLRRLCNTLHGIEVSATALERAKLRIPDAHLSVGDLTQQRYLEDGQHFDLVVACEVLYYVKDVRGTIDLMNHVGDACFVTFFAPEARKLTAVVEEMPQVTKSWFVHEGVTWLMAWWRNRPSGASMGKGLAAKAVATLSLIECAFGEFLQIGVAIAAGA